MTERDAEPSTASREDLAPATLRRVPSYFLGSDYDGDQHLIADASERDASQWVVEMWSEDDRWQMIKQADGFASYSQLEPEQVCWRTFDRRAPLRVWLPGEEQPYVIREGLDVVEAASQPCPQCGKRLGHPWLWSPSCNTCGDGATYACQECCSVLMDDGSRHHRGVRPCSCGASGKP